MICCDLALPTCPTGAGASAAADAPSELLFVSGRGFDGGMACAFGAESATAGGGPALPASAGWVSTAVIRCEARCALCARKLLLPMRPKAAAAYAPESKAAAALCSL